MNLKLFPEATIVVITGDKEQSQSVQSLLERNSFGAICEAKDSSEHILSLINKGCRTLLFTSSLNQGEIEEYLTQIKSHRASTNDLIVIRLISDKQGNEKDLYQVFLSKIAAYPGSVEGVMMSFNSEHQRLCKQAWIGSHAGLWCDLSVPDCRLPFCTAVLDNKTIELFLFNFHPHPYLLPSREKVGMRVKIKKEQLK